MATSFQNQAINFKDISVCCPLVYYFIDIQNKTAFSKSVLCKHADSFYILIIFFLTKCQIQSNQNICSVSHAIWYLLSGTKLLVLDNNLIIVLLDRVLCPLTL